MFAPAADRDRADLALVLHAEVQGEDAAEREHGQQRQAERKPERRHGRAVPRVFVDGRGGGGAGENDRGPELDVGVRAGRGAGGDCEEHGLVGETVLVAAGEGGLVQEPFLVGLDVDEAVCVGGFPLCACVSARRTRPC